MTTGVRRDDWWPNGQGQHEVTYALNLITLELRRFRGARADADKWKAQFGPQWLTGTIDWLGTMGGLPWLDDLKTGRWPVDPRTKQLPSYGLFSYFESGRHADYQAHRSITQWPKYPINGLPVRKWGPLMTALELEEHLDDLRWALEHPTETNPGEEQCRFCDSAPVCPSAWYANG